MANTQQDGKRSSYLASASNKRMLSTNMILAMLILIVAFDHTGNCIDLAKQQSRNHQNSNNNNNNDNKEVFNKVINDQPVPLDSYTNLASSNQQQPQRLSLVKRSIYTDGDELAMPMLMRQQVVKQRAPSQLGSVPKSDQLVEDQDHELPADYYYYHLQQQQQQQQHPTIGTIGGGNGESSNSALMNSNIRQQQQQSNTNGQYRDFNTLVYPEGDHGNYDVEKRPDWGTTKSSLNDQDLFMSEPLKSALSKLLYQSAIGNEMDRDQQQMASAPNERQRWKRRGSSSCNFNSGLTSKCDNMDYLQAWNHHNWFHKKTLPG